MEHKTQIGRGFFALAVFYGGMVTFAGVMGNKQVALGPLAVEAGIFPFLLLVVIASAFAELYGQKIANRLVLFGFIPLIGSIVISQLILALPPSPKMEPDRLDAFNLMVGSTWRIWLAGIVAYGISQMLNVTVFSYMKREGGRLLWLRSAVAGVISQVVDTLLFVTIAFYGVFPIMTLLMGQMLAKALLSILLVPLLVGAAVALARRWDSK